MSLAQALLQGDRRALSRALTWVENAAPEGEELLKALFPHTGKAHLVGITGPPGVGKSTLVNQLARYYRKDHMPPKTVAIVAVDPTSPFTGGALLGDRIRMRDLTGDPGVFIRSMASRGAVGGLAWATGRVAQVLDAAGFDLIFIETVGTGQAEVDIARLAHTVVVVQAPGLGDEVQALKAGILEIADILVVNKADRPGAAEMARTLAQWLPKAEREGEEASSWQPPVLLTTALRGQGIPEVARALEAHRAFLQRTGLWQARERHRLEAEIRERLREALWQTWEAGGGRERLEAMVQAVLQRKMAPQDAVRRLLEASSEQP